MKQVTVHGSVNQRTVSIKNPDLFSNDTGLCVAWRCITLLLCFGTIL